jgi:hypothetical protein
MTALRPMFGSGSVNGNMVAIAATSTALHAAEANTNHIDEVYVYACNIHTANVTLTLEIDGTGAGSQMIETIPYKY